MEVLALLSGPLLVIPLWVIHRRAGQNPAFALLSLIPLVGLALNALILAFGAWGDPERRRWS